MKPDVRYSISYRLQLVDGVIVIDKTVLLRLLDPVYEAWKSDAKCHGSC